MNEVNPLTQELVSEVSPISAIIVVVITFFAVLFFGAFFFLIFGTGLALVFSELLILLVPLSYMLIKRVSIKRFIGFELKPKFIVLGFASGFVLLFINIVVSLVLTSIFGISQAVEESNALITDLSSSTSGLIVALTALFLAGVCEEFTFRGFLQNSINRRYSFIPAVAVSSLFFGLFHFDPQLVYILSAIAGGIVLGYIYHRWNSYLVSSIAHSTLNLLVLAALVFAV